MKTSAPTLRRDQTHRVASALLLFTIAFLVSTNTLGAQGSSTRVESFALKPGGEVRVENSRGSTRVDAWEGRTVRVTAEKKAPTESALEAGELVLMGMGNTVFIGCKQGSSPARIDLTVYVPRGSQLEVTGGAWPVDVTGSLAGAIVETTSGSIAYRLPSLDDARITMQSTQGVVKSTLALADSERDGAHLLRGRIGEGLAEIALNSQSGNIMLAPGANSAAMARNVNKAGGTNTSAAQPSSNSRQSRASDFDRPPLTSQQANDAGGDPRNDPQDDQGPADNANSTGDVAAQSNRRMPRANNTAASGNGPAVFAGSDVADQSTSSSERGMLDRNRQSKSSSSGNAGMRVRITPGAIPSSGNAGGSVYDQPDDQDADSDLNRSSQASGNQRRPSNRSSSGAGTAVFAGSGVSDDDGYTSKRGPFEHERKNKVMRGGDAGLRVRIIPADQALGGSQSSDNSIFPQPDDPDDSEMSDEPTAKTKGSSNKPSSQLPRTNDYDQANGTRNSRSTYDAQNGRRDTTGASEPDSADEIASANARNSAPPVLRRDSPELSPDETTDPRSAAGGGDAIVLKSALVNLNVSVTNRSGASFGNLKKEDFRVAENGEAQKVEFFAPTTAPFNLVLLLDLSGSIQDKLEVIKAAAVRFLDVIEPQDRVAVVTFTDQVRVVSPLTANRNELKERILAIRRPQGGTAFYEALWFSLVETLRNSRGQRNAIVVMTDGVDSSLDRYNPAPTRVSFNQLARRLEESDTLVFPIYLDTEYEEVFERGNSTSEAYAIGRDQLDRIAEVSGARLFKAEKASDLAGVYKQVAASIRTMYSVGYYPTNLEKDGTYRRVRVTVNKPDAAVRTRKGYYSR